MGSSDSDDDFQNALENHAPTKEGFFRMCAGCCRECAKGFRKFSSELGLFVGVISLITSIFFFVITLAISKNDKTCPAIFTPNTTIEAIQYRGKILVGVADDKLGFSFYNETDDGEGEYEGFEADLARILTLAFFGRGAKVNERLQFVDIKSRNRFQMLNDRLIDVIARVSSISMVRMLREPSTLGNFTFSTPYIVDGLRFVGEEPYIGCADDLRSDGVCANTRVCVVASTTHKALLEDHNIQVQRVEQASNIKNYYGRRPSEGDYCNVVARDGIELRNVTQELRSLQYNVTPGKFYHSMEALALVTRSDDRVWSEFVDGTVQALLAAESIGDKEFISIFGENSFWAIQKYGTFFEIYKKHLGDPDTQNQLNKGQQPLMHSYPFLESQESLRPAGDPPVQGGTISKVQGRDQLVCAVLDGGGGFFEQDDSGMWKGIDVDYCNAISFALLEKEAKIVVVESAKEGFEILTDALDVDIFSGAPATPRETDRIPGMNVSFTRPINYIGRWDRGDTRALATRQDDRQFELFVYWVVESLVFAAERGISNATYDQMPTTFLFGLDLSEIFQRAVKYVGSYVQACERHFSQSQCYKEVNSLSIRYANDNGHFKFSEYGGPLQYPGGYWKNRDSFAK